MKVLVIGANGQIGKQLVKKLKSHGHEPVAMVRDVTQQKAFEDKGFSTVLADLEKDFDKAFESGLDAVVFAAGSGASTGKDKTHLIDRIGAKRAIDLAVKNQVDRFIMVSAFGADFSPEEWPDSMVFYYEAKADADKHLMQTELNYTILKPGRLTNENGQGSIQLGEKTSERSGEVTRSDVASVIVNILNKENTYKTSLELLQGTEPIDKAVEAV